MCDDEKEEQVKEKDLWDKLKIFSLFLIPVIVAIMGSIVNLTLKKSEVQLKMVELSLEILKKDPNQSVHDRGLREWAVQILEDKAGMQFLDDTRDALLEGPLFTFTGTMSVLGNIAKQGKPEDQKVAARFLRLHLLDSALADQLENVEKVIGFNVGIDANTKDSAGNSALLLACRQGHLKTAIFLLSKGADPGMANNQSDTPLLIAAREGHADVVSLLIKHLNPEQINYKNKYNDKALQLAVSGLKLEIVKILLKTKGIDTSLPFTTRKKLKRATDDISMEIKKLLDIANQTGR